MGEFEDAMNDGEFWEQMEDHKIERLYTPFRTHVICCECGATLMEPVHEVFYGPGFGSLIEESSSPYLPCLTPSALERSHKARHATQDPMRGAGDNKG